MDEENRRLAFLRKYSQNVPMRIGYARTSPLEGDPTPQTDALVASGCDQIYLDAGIPAGARSRAEFQRLFAALSTGDVLVVWRLDRLGRSLSHLVGLVCDLAKRGIDFHSLCEGIDTSAPDGKVWLNAFTALAAFDREILVERTRVGFVAAQRQGSKPGRKPKLSSAQIAQARQMIDQGESPSQVAKSFSVSPATLYRAIPAAASNRNTQDLFRETAE